MIDLTQAPVSALLELHGDLLAELRRREVVRSANNPTGDYGELRRLRVSNGSRQLGFIRRLPDRPLDRLAAVLLDSRFRVLRGAIIPFEVVEPRAAYVDSVKAWRFMLRDAVWDLPGVLDVTVQLKTAEQGI